MIKQSPRDKLKTAKSVLLTAATVLTMLVLVLSLFSRNIVTKYRSDFDYVKIENVQVTAVKNGSTFQNECRFTPEKIGYAETLAFFINHNDIQVFVGEECVYTSVGANDAFTTSGGTWVMIPLYTSDTGKEIKVILIPHYSNYTDKIPTFMLGSEIAVHNATLHRSMPALVLCLCVIFAGFLLLCLAVYHSAKGMTFSRLYALSIMAISTGIWRISYDKVAYIFFENYSVFIYTISIISLMFMALSMLNSLEMDEKLAKVVRVVSCVYCAIYSVQLFLQFFGVLDLRQTLKLVHATLIVSVVFFLSGGIGQIIRLIAKRDVKFNFSWLLGIGVAADMVMYYRSADSVKIICTLIAILLYTVLEGIGLMFTYIEQKNELEEMQTQLTLSRTTTMMSQIRSHFVFNLLNAISGMCKYDPKMADDTIVRFSRYLRNNIDIMENDNNLPFEIELQHLEDYVALEQVRFGDKIEFYSDVETDNFVIPPLILQPVVENAIKHGVSKKEGNGTIILRTRETEKNVVITVEDDGVGFNMEELDKEHSVGIRNIRFRLEHLVNGELDIQSEVGKGTIVTISIPKDDFKENE